MNLLSVEEEKNPNLVPQLDSKSFSVLLGKVGSRFTAMCCIVLSVCPIPEFI